MSRTLTVTLRGRKVEIQYAPIQPDLGVGLMGPGFEDETLTDELTGERLDWELTDAEIERVSAVLAESYGGDE